MSWVFSTSFSPLEAVAGGSLLGVGVAALYVFTGKILGVSGIGMCAASTPRRGMRS
jgi:hypothetical protein